MALVLLDPHRGRAAELRAVQERREEQGDRLRRVLDAHLDGFADAGVRHDDLDLRVRVGETEAILHGTVAAFAFFRCVPKELWWDNPKTVATTILRGRQRELNDRWQALASHYNFEPLFCLPARGNEILLNTTTDQVLAQNIGQDTTFPSMEFATEDHSLEWLFPLGDIAETSYPAFIAEIGALAMGSTTCEWILRNGDSLIRGFEDEGFADQGLGIPRFRQV